MTRWVIPIVALAALGACGGDSSTPIQEVGKTCKATANVDDDGRSISFDTKGEDDTSGDDVKVVACALVGLHVPDSIIQRLNHTRALDGTQSADWDKGKYKATWSYHPDSGMFIVMEDQS